MKNEYDREEFQMSLLPTGKFRHACRTRDAFIKDTWPEQAQASEDLQKDGIRGGELMSNDRISLAHARARQLEDKILVWEYTSFIFLFLLSS
jgi:hypothetical protein